MNVWLRANGLMDLVYFLRGQDDDGNILRDCCFSVVMRARYPIGIVVVGKGLICAAVLGASARTGSWSCDGKIADGRQHGRDDGKGKEWCIVLFGQAD